jgi:hypothetical protein
MAGVVAPISAPSLSISRSEKPVPSNGAPSRCSSSPASLIRLNVLKPVRPWRPDATTPAERIAWPDDFGPHFLVWDRPPPDNRPCNSGRPRPPRTGDGPERGPASRWSERAEAGPPMASRRHHSGRADRMAGRLRPSLSGVRDAFRQDRHRGGIDRHRIIDHAIQADPGRREPAMGRSEGPHRAGRTVPPDFGPHFLVFVDVEEEFDWSAPLDRRHRSTSAMRASTNTRK